MPFNQEIRIADPRYACAAYPACADGSCVMSPVQLDTQFGSTEFISTAISTISTCDDPQRITDMLNYFPIELFNQQFTLLERSSMGSGPQFVKRTILMFSVMYGRKNILERLIRSIGINIIDVNAVSDTDKLTALDCNFLYKPPNSKEIEAFLVELGARYSDPRNPGGLLRKIEREVRDVTRLKEQLVESCKFIDLKEEVNGYVLQSDTFMLNRFKRVSCIWKKCGSCCPYLHGNDQVPNTCLMPNTYRTRECGNKMVCERENCIFFHNSMEMRLAITPEKETYPHSEMTNPQKLSRTSSPSRPRSDRRKGTEMP